MKTAASSTRLLLSAALLLVGAGLLLPGCGSSTAPGGGDDDVVLRFSPSAQFQELGITQNMEFSVTVSGADTASVNWIQDNAILGNAMTYNYVPRRLGVDTLKVQAAAGETQRAYYWLIDVTSSGGSLPGAVPQVAAGPGPGAGEVAVTWTRVTNAPYPLDEYVVAVSYTGPITDQNWSAAIELRRITHRVGQVGYDAVFNAPDDGMIPGADAWFAVRAVDELGQMSPIAENGYTTITTAWWVTGTVRDDTGAVIEGVIIRAASPEIQTNSDLNGNFSLGPLRSSDTVVIETTSLDANGEGWYDFRSGVLDSISGRDYAVLLVKRHVMDVTCDLYEYQFLNYFRYMTLTQYDALEPGSSLLYRWEEYPLKVYAPEVMADGGFGMRETLEFATAFWDSVMGEPYFTYVGDPAAADIVCRFDNSDPGVYGRVSLTSPGGQGQELGDVIPLEMELYMRTDINFERFAREVAIHELGHTLGIYNHSACRDSGFLMVEGASGALTLPDPIHPNEQALVRAIRYLDQGVDMRQYSITK